MDIKELQSAVPGAKRHPWESAKLEVVKYLLGKYKAGVELSHSTVLDVGCGDLFLLRHLSEQYKEMELFGVDTAIDLQVSESALSQMLYPNIKLSSSLKEVDRNVFHALDFVFLLDVLEHIEDDIDYLKELLACRFISDETCFIITAPAFQCLTCSHDRYLGHYRRYSNRILRENLQAAGLQIVDIGYFFSSLLIPRAFQKVFEVVHHKRINQEQGVSHWKHHQVVTTLAMKALYCDFRAAQLLKKITRLNIPGLSNFVVCRKKPVS